MKRPLSICLITYNEEHNIRRCLESVRWADEIVVVDSKSQDRTVAICRQYTDKIFLRDFPGFVEQRNFAIDHATHSWVFLLDADEEVSPELRESIESVLNSPTLQEAGFSVSRKTSYLGEWVTYGRWYPDYKLRLFDRGKGRAVGVNPHDHIAVTGRTGRLKGELLHRTYQDLTHHVRVINNYTTIAAKEKAGRRMRFPLLRAVSHGLAYFVDSYLLRRALFYGARGFILSVMGAFYVFLKYAKVWEIRHCKPGSPPAP